MSLFNSSYFAKTGPKRPIEGQGVGKNKRNNTHQGPPTPTRRQPPHKNRAERDARRNIPQYPKEQKPVGETKNPSASVDEFFERERAYFRRPIDLDALRNAMVEFGLVIVPDEQKADARSSLIYALDNDYLQSVLMTHSYLFRLAIVASQYAYEDICVREELDCDRNMYRQFMDECLARPLEAKWGVEIPSYEYGELESHPVVQDVRRVFESIHTAELTQMRKAFYSGVAEVRGPGESKHVMSDEEKKAMDDYIQDVNTYYEQHCFENSQARFASTGPRATTVFTNADDNTYHRWVHTFVAQYAHIIAKTWLQWEPRLNTVGVSPFESPVDNDARSFGLNLAANEVSVIQLNDVGATFLNVEPRHLERFTDRLGNVAYENLDEMIIRSEIKKDKAFTILKTSIDYINKHKQKLTDLIMSKGAVRPSRILPEENIFYEQFMYHLNTVNSIIGRFDIVRGLGITHTFYALLQRRWVGAMAGGLTVAGVLAFFSRLDDLLLLSGENITWEQMASAMLNDEIKIGSYDSINLALTSIRKHWTYLADSVFLGLEMMCMKKIVAHMHRKTRGLATGLTDDALIQYYHDEEHNWCKNTIYFNGREQDGKKYSVVNNLEINEAKRGLGKLRQIALPVASIITKEDNNYIVIDRMGASKRYGVITWNESLRAIEYPIPSQALIMNKYGLVSQMNVRFSDKWTNIAGGSWVQRVGMWAASLGPALTTTAMGLAYFAGISSLTPIFVVGGIASAATAWTAWNTPASVSDDASVGDARAFVLLEQNVGDQVWEHVVWDVVTGKIYTSDTSRQVVERLRKRQEEYQRAVDNASGNSNLQMLRSELINIHREIYIINDQIMERRHLIEEAKQESPYVGATLGTQPTQQEVQAAAIEQLENSRKYFMDRLRIIKQQISQDELPNTFIDFIPQFSASGDKLFVGGDEYILNEQSSHKIYVHIKNNV